MRVYISKNGRISEISEKFSSSIRCAELPQFDVAFGENWLRWFHRFPSKAARHRAGPNRDRPRPGRDHRRPGRDRRRPGQVRLHARSTGPLPSSFCTTLYGLWRYLD